MANDRSINLKYCTDKLSVEYPHVGLVDAQNLKAWIAKPVPNNPHEALRIAHARLLQGGSEESSTVEKDRYLCYWFHTPNSGNGYVQGYPIEWSEGHLLVRLDPHWDYKTRKFIAPTQIAKIERNIEVQYNWAMKLFKSYLAIKPPFALSWHLIGPRPTDSMFYVQREESRG